VRWAEVSVVPEREPAATGEPAGEGQVAGRIERGLLVYVGVGTGDTPADAERLAEKVAFLRIFPDAEGKLNLSVRDVRGGVLVVPNFTLLADARKGRRPAFDRAAPADQARPLHDAFVQALRRHVGTVAAGVFGANMIIRSAADGPVNILMDWPGLPTG